MNALAPLVRLAAALWLENFALVLTYLDRDARVLSCAARVLVRGIGILETLEFQSAK